MIIYKLYVKQLPNGNLYLGRTIKDPFKYLGSGTLWKRTIKKNNYKLVDIKTWVLFETSIFTELRELGLYYSKLFDIVKNKIWLNLIEESGEGLTNPTEELRSRLSKAKLGVKRKPFTDATKQKMREVKLNVPLSDYHREAISISNKSQKERDKRSIAFTGRKLSDETRKKISDKIKEKWENSDYETRKQKTHYRNNLIIK